MMRKLSVWLGVLLLLVAACGGSDDGGGGDNTGGGNSASSTSDIDVCSLLSEAEIVAAVGESRPSQPTEPAGPFTGCKWGTGFLTVQIAPSVTLITSPLEAESDCPSVGVGDQSSFCFGAVKFLVNGIHVSITSLDNLTEGQLTAVANALLPKLENL